MFTSWYLCTVPGVVPQRPVGASATGCLSHSPQSARKASCSVQSGDTPVGPHQRAFTCHLLSEVLFGGAHRQSSSHVDCAACRRPCERETRLFSARLGAVEARGPQHRPGWPSACCRGRGCSASAASALPKAARGATRAMHTMGSCCGKPCHRQPPLAISRPELAFGVASTSSRARDASSLLCQSRRRRWQTSGNVFRRTQHEGGSFAVLLSGSVIVTRDRVAQGADRFERPV